VATDRSTARNDLRASACIYFLSALDSFLPALQRHRPTQCTDGNRLRQARSRDGGPIAKCSIAIRPPDTYFPRIGEMVMATKEQQASTSRL
jgi:hypothetical protein